MKNWILSEILRAPAVQMKQRYERHLRTDQFYDATRCCPTCGYSGQRISVLTLQADPLVEYLRCPDCRGCSTSHLPTPAYLANYYGHYYEPDEKKVTFPSSIRRFAEHIIKGTVLGYRGDKLKILDFGGGDGAIAKDIAAILLKSHPNLKISILVVDYHEPEPYARDGVEFTSVQKLDDVKDDDYHLVVASAILEHVPELRPVIQSLFAVTAPGGHIYIRVPWVLPLRKWISSVPLLWPMHLHDLGPSFWNRLPERENLDADVVRSQPPLSETEFRHHFLLTTLSYAMKLPARIELMLRRRPKDMLWEYVAGWEVIYAVK